MKSKTIKPNAFIIGAQKSGTTSIYNWIAQHPMVCGPMGVKDFGFFARDDFFNRGTDFLTDAYLSENSNKKIILQGSVQYLFYPVAIERIFNFNPDSKLIVIIRNPIDRAISAYNYFKKMGLETLSFKDAIDSEPERLKRGDYQITSGLTYINHGLYGKQLEHVYKYFDKKNILILRFKDVKSKPQTVMTEIYKFLDIYPDFIPEFKILNKTGTIRSQWFQDFFFAKNKFRSKIVSLIDPILSRHTRAKLRWLLNEWNTIPTNRTEDSFVEEKKYLQNYFVQDISLIEELTDLDLSDWKQSAKNNIQNGKQT